jgi:serine/threonine protein kinase/tetratricopeptide (TPR) repeat protein
MSLSNAPAGPSSQPLVERLVEEMNQRWQRGERPVTEEYLDRYPQLWQQPQSAAELIYEEVCLRQQLEGAEGAAADVLARFPQWRQQLQVLLDCHHLLEGPTAPLRFPEPGETLGDFHLLAELGRGARGRVFLATQPALAERAVVLKLIPRSGGEHLSLARLQHTHIVPLYSVHDYPDRGLRALCMPYFGGLTLAALLEGWRGQPPEGRSGLHVLQALERAQGSAPLALPVRGPGCDFLAGATYVGAVCWLGTGLADALQHASDHGLVHLDLKPANVLLAADGQPMLLDFHLAHGPIAPGSVPRWLGGTPAYMAPEHRAALAALAEGRAVPLAVDARADVYALGLLLYETLGGPLPVPAQPARALRRANAGVSPGLADLLGKCLAADPSRRYAGGAAVAGDLRRHLADLPLEGVANRSWRERWAKWRRRRPHALALYGLLLGLVAAAGLALAHGRQQLDRARAALAEGHDHLREERHEQAIGELKRGLALAEHIPFGGDLTAALRQELRRAEQGYAAGELHLLAERLRTLAGAEVLPPPDAQAVEALCRSFWQRRDLIARRLGRPGQQEQVQADLLDLAVLWTALRVQRAGGRAQARREALEVLEQAEQFFGPSRVLYHERQVHAEALGWTDLAQRAARQGAALAPRTAWEQVALGRALFRAGKLPQAEALCERALEEQPHNLWANYYKGRCAYQQGRHADAAIAFTACVVLAPDRAWCFHNRGLAYEGLGRLEQARRDYDHALRLDPALAGAALNRAMLHYRAGRHAKALADLRRARASGANPAMVCYNQALVHLARKDRAAARQSLREALHLEPGHTEARTLLDKLGAER